ncbi:MAG: MFS transporter [Deltaproteobacteria bacterium]|nr:MFS transporter [Deltaproteobacteria bacterium]
MTTARRTSGKVFYGWWVVLAAGVGLALHAGPLIVPTFGVFLKPLSQEFGWSRTQLSLAFSLFTLGLTITMPLIGRLVDRLGARKVIVPAVLLFGLGVLSLSVLSAHLWHFYAVYLFLGVVGSGTALVPYTKVISRWFDRKRGLALGLAAATFSASASLMPPLAQTLIAAVGWRRTYEILGLMVMGITIPVVMLLLKESPQMMGLEPDGESIEQAEVAKQRSPEDGVSFQEARQTGTFWLMGGTFFLISVCFHGCVIHLVPLLTDRGFSTQSAALVASLPAVAGLIGKVGIGYLLDRCFAPYVAVCFFCGFALGLFLLWSGMAGGVVLMAVMLVGLGVGAELDVMPYMVSRYFGLRAFGEIYSYTFALFTLGGVIGPLLMGAGFDATGSYRLVLGTFVMAALTAAGLMTRLGPYRAWEVGVEPVVVAGVSRA